MTTGHHTKTAVQHRIIMLQNNGKAEWNKQMICGVGARRHRETFTWWSRNLKFGFRWQSPGLWCKRVNFLRDERGLLYVYIIILVCMGVGRGVQGDLGPTGFWNLKNVCLLASSWKKIKFNNCCSPWKNPLLPPWKKNFRRPSSYVYNRVSQTFYTCPTIHQIFI